MILLLKNFLNMRILSNPLKFPQQFYYLMNVLFIFFFFHDLQSVPLWYYRPKKLTFLFYLLSFDAILHELLVLFINLLLFLLENILLTDCFLNCRLFFFIIWGYTLYFSLLDLLSNSDSLVVLVLSINHLYQGSNLCRKVYLWFIPK